MTPEEWQRVKEVLQAALDLDPQERETFLNSACASQESMRNEIESLLRSHDQDEAFLEHPVVFDAADFVVDALPAAWIGRRLGPYQVLEQVGEGGMGAVYRAVRVDGLYEKQVAIKLVRNALSADFFASRFKNERQILAALEHPNISRLLDGGVTEEGLPYVVLEFVDGTPIDEYCALHDLSTTERLKLFRTVCSAVQYAHQNLVVHRDLKPGNILVTEDGIPKLLDFGIAKILDPQQDEAGADRTLTVMRMMTPDFASPEQVRGDPITTASDVYSLGVILYLLLTGRLPYRVSSTTPHEIIKAICDTDPEKPSTAVTHPEKSKNPVKAGSAGTAKESSEPDSKREKLRRTLSGDLDNIILKALRKEPERRYATVEQLAEDIRRHLEHLPVSARADTAGYLASRFILRHRIGVAITAVVSLLLFGALAIVGREARIARAERNRAERRFNDVRKLANSMIFQVHDAIQTLPGATSARKLLVQQGLDYLDSLAGESGDDPGLQKELAAGYVKLGDLQGNSALGNVGDTTGAIASYRKAVKIREGLIQSIPHDSNLQRDLAVSYQKLARVLRGSGNQKEAVEYLEKALIIASPLAEREPNNAETLMTLGFVQFERGSSLWGQADYEAALHAYLDSAGAFRRVAASDPADLRVRRGLAVAYKSVGGLLEYQNKLGDAMESYLRASDIDRELLARDPGSAQYQRDSTVDFRNLGDVLVKQGKLSEARKYYYSAMAIDGNLVKQDPADRDTQQKLADDHEGIGKVLLRLGTSSAALDSLRTAVALHEALCKADPNDAWAKSVLARSYELLGDSYTTLARPALESRRQTYLTAGCSAYDHALNMWNVMKAAGVLDNRDAAVRSAVLVKMEKCK
ncbi:MAG TPA: protein kinase [Candidatus Acidoferrum sp.]|nr:protein kinase [Candidatus Acidoferrum sp.]